MKKPTAKRKVAPNQLAFGLFASMDTELYSSLHDEIMLWLDRNAERIVVELFPDYAGCKLRKRWEYPVTATHRKDEYIAGFIDFAVEATNRRPIYFEVKTDMGLGVLFRQLGAYHFYLGNNRVYEDEPSMSGPFVVVSPDDRHADLINEQGYRFYKYVPS